MVLFLGGKGNNKGGFTKKRIWGRILYEELEGFQKIIFREQVPTDGESQSSMVVVSLPLLGSHAALFRSIILVVFYQNGLVEFDVLPFRLPKAFHPGFLVPKRNQMVYAMYAIA